MIRESTRPLEIARPEQVTEVSFDEAQEAEIQKLLKRYPTKQAALLPTLWLARSAGAGSLRAS